MIISGIREKLFQKEVTIFGQKEYQPPAFTGINFGNRKGDEEVPIDIVKLILTGADVLIPDNPFFHEQLTEDQRIKRSKKYSDACQAAIDVYNLDKQIMLASELDHVPFKAVRAAYEAYPELRQIIAESFNPKSVEYILAESAICMRMEDKGYQTKIGPPSEKKFDRITEGFCSDLKFAYTIQAKALHSKKKLNHELVSIDVVDYTTTSMSHRGVNSLDRITFDDDEELIKKKLRFANSDAIAPLYIVATIAEYRIQPSLEPMNLLKEIPLKYRDLVNETTKKVIEFVVQPIKRSLSEQNER